jgi:hypothetical protein
MNHEKRYNKIQFFRDTDLISLAEMGANIAGEYDELSQNYYIVWQSIVIGSGGTKEHALEDLRDAAHFGVDTIIDLKLGDIGCHDS